MSLDPPIRRILAPNPSPLTGTGTNTWIVGSSELVVIDPGPDDFAHLTAILAAPKPGQRITRIVVTHPHLDHSALAPALAARTGAEVLAYGPATAGRSDIMVRIAPHLGPQGEGLDTAFAPDRRLADGERIEGPDFTLEALHTPGHLGSHLCLSLGQSLFSGDHVMGWSTSIVSPPDGDMGDYMTSLRRLKDGPWTRFLPGHGDAVEDPSLRVAALIAHRLQREGQVLDLLAEGPANVGTLTRRIYHETPAQLLVAAERNVLAHLIDLTSRNLAACDHERLTEAMFSLA